MNTTVKEAMILARELKESLRKVVDREIVVCPPYVSLADLRTIFHRTNIILGSQNMHYEDKGAFTGEISPIMLKGLCQYVILGHSERRHLFEETDYIINKKIHAAIKHRLKPILCVGETDKEREEGKAQDIVHKQLEESLRDIEGPEIKEIIISYEPLWAIGTGKTATPNQIEEMHFCIKNWLKDKFEKDGKIRVLYGGSVTPDNISDIMKIDSVDGVLVGGASLSSESFVKIVNN